MQRTSPIPDEDVQMSSVRFVVVYAVLVLALMIINVAGYGLIALTV